MNARTKILVDLALGIARSEKKEIREDDDTLDVHNLQQQPSTSTNYNTSKLFYILLKNNIQLIIRLYVDSFF